MTKALSLERSAIEWIRWAPPTDPKGVYGGAYESAIHGSMRGTLPRVQSAIILVSLLMMTMTARAAESSSDETSVEVSKEISVSSEADASLPPMGPGVAPSSADVAALTQQGDYHVKLRDMEERVSQLKEKIFQSKARLIQLQEVILHGTISGARAVLIHKNEMGSSFRLAKIQYALDGAPIYNRSDSGDSELEVSEEFEFYTGSIAPGNHQLSVYLEYQGHGYGIFSYLKAYRFKIKSSYTFTAEEGKLITIRVVAYEKGGITTELQDRPAVRYDVDVAKDLSSEVSSGVNIQETTPSPNR